MTLRHQLIPDIIVPVSGGKDSQLVLQRTVNSVPRDRIRVVHQYTGYDHPLTMEHLSWMEEYYKIKITHTKSEKYDSLFDMIRKIRYFPTSGARACTGRLKQLPFARWLESEGYLRRPCIVLFGMRSSESRNRNQQYEEVSPDDKFTLCDLSSTYSKKFKAITVQLPIVNISTSEVYDELMKSGARINPLYSKGHKRVGCYPCLLAGKSEWRLAARDVVGRQHIEILLTIEREFAQRPKTHKLIRIHSDWDIRKMLCDELTSDQKGIFYEDDEEEAPQCSWCNQ